jgi:hypothetical protein
MCKIRPCFIVLCDSKIAFVFRSAMEAIVYIEESIAARTEAKLRPYSYQIVQTSII